MTIAPRVHGKQLVLNVTCGDTLTNSRITGSLTAAGHAAEEAEKMKVRKYRNLADRFHFSSLGFETFGSWGSSAKALIAPIGKRITDHTGETRATKYLKQRISIEIQRFNAVSVLNSGPFEQGLDEVSYD